MQIWIMFPTIRKSLRYGKSGREVKNSCAETEKVSEVVKSPIQKRSQTAECSVAAHEEGIVERDTEISLFHTTSCLQG